MMTQAAIYARYSSDRQSHASIEDQVGLCEERATRDVCQVVETYADRAVSGALMGLGGKIMTYDGENRPLSVTHLGKRTCYVYGTDGKRLQKVEGLPPTQDCTALPANANTTVYFGAVEVRNWLVAGAEQVLTYPHPAVKLLNGTSPAVATYLHRDGLSSVRAITNAAGVKIESALYKPFGEQSEWLLPGIAAPETKGWIGERYDADVGRQYLNARCYDPELNLFLQPDWFEVTKAGVGTKRFSYSFNNPVDKMAPGGNYCIPCGVEAVKWAGITIGSAIVGYTAVETIDGSIVSNPIEEMNLGQESVQADPSAGEATVLADPQLDDFQSNVEGMSVTEGSGPTIRSNPVSDFDLSMNIVQASPLRGALVLKPHDGVIAHHNIPKEHRYAPAVKAAVRAG
jgi:RHS repeat-associated protein